MSSNFTYDVKVPVDENFDENEASEICDQRGLRFSRFGPEIRNIYESVHIYCNSYIEGWVHFVT